MNKTTVTTEIIETTMEGKIPAEIIWLSLGATGGIVRVFFDYLNEPEHPTFGRFVTILFMNMIISGFSGFMGAVFGSLINDNLKWIIICAGVFGYLGTAGIKILATEIKKRISIG